MDGRRPTDTMGDQRRRQQQQTDSFFVRQVDLEWATWPILSSPSVLASRGGQLVPSFGFPCSGALDPHWPRQAPLIQVRRLSHVDNGWSTDDDRRRWMVGDRPTRWVTNGDGSSNRLTPFSCAR